MDMSSGAPDNFYLIPIIMGSIFGVIFLVMISTFIFCAIRHNKRNKRNLGIQSSPVVVTSSTHTSPDGVTVTQTPQTHSQPNTLYTASYPGRSDVTVDMSMLNQQNRPQGPPPCMPPIQVTPAPVPAMNAYPSGAPAMNANPNAAPALNAFPSAAPVSANPPPYDIAVAQEASTSNYDQKYKLR